MRALSELFVETRLLVPVRELAAPKGEIYLAGNKLTVVPLTSRSGSGLSSKLSFFPWLLRNSVTIFRELRAADAIHTPIPGDVGTVGMLFAWALRKPLFVRHCGNWLKPVTVAEKLWRRFMESTAGGHNVMLATGGMLQAPSAKNSNVHWIFSSSLTQDELKSWASPRSFPSNGAIRLVIVARQEIAKGAGTVIRSLPLLAKQFPKIEFEIVGDGSAIPEFTKLARELGVADRVHFAGKLNHEQVMARLKAATLFMFPTTSSDGFPKAVLEGLASGLPVIATRVSVLPKLLGNGCGILIDEPTPEAVARGVEMALADSAAYEAMSRHSIETARQYSLETWRVTIGGYLTKAWGPLGRKDEGGKLRAEKVRFQA